MPTFRVFLGAPSLNDVDNDIREYQWQNISSLPQSEPQRDKFPNPTDFPAVEALDDASRRISLVYQNAIFNEDAEEEDEPSEGVDDGRPILAGTGTECMTFLS
jgi:hypothetical protein